MNDARNRSAIRAGNARPGFTRERRSRDALRMLTVLAIFWTGGSLSLAAEPTAPAAAKPAPAKSEAAQDAKDQSAAKKPGDPAAPAPAQSRPQQSASSEADEQPPPPPPGSKGPSPQRFVPSEQVRADFDVSFPIDI